MYINHSGTCLCMIVLCEDLLRMSIIAKSDNVNLELDNETFSKLAEVITYKTICMTTSNHTELRLESDEPLNLVEQAALLANMIQYFQT